VFYHNEELEGGDSFPWLRLEEDRALIRGGGKGERKGLIGIVRSGGKEHLHSISPDSIPEE